MANIFQTTFYNKLTWNTGLPCISLFLRVQLGDEQLSELMMTHINHAYMRHYTSTSLEIEKAFKLQYSYHYYYYCFLRSKPQPQMTSAVNDALSITAMMESFFYLVHPLGNPLNWR